MHVLQPKHIKLKDNEAKALLEKLRITKFQLPKIKKTDAMLSEDVKIGDIIKIERKTEDNVNIYYRLVIP